MDNWASGPKVADLVGWDRSFKAKPSGLLSPGKGADLSVRSSFFLAWMIKEESSPHVLTGTFQTIWDELETSVPFGLPACGHTGRLKHRNGF